MAHMNLQYVNPKPFFSSICRCRKEKRRYHANLLCTVISSKNGSSRLQFCSPNCFEAMRMPRRALPLVKVGSVKIFSLCYGSFPFVRSHSKNYPLTHGARCCHLQHKRVAKSMFSLLCMSLALLFLKFRFSVVKKMYTVIQMS